MVERGLMSESEFGPPPGPTFKSLVTGGGREGDCWDFGEGRRTVREDRGVD